MWWTSHMIIKSASICTVHIWQAQNEYYYLPMNRLLQTVNRIFIYIFYTTICGTQTEK